MQCGDSQACQIIIDHVIPFLGVFTGLTIYLAPWKDVHASLRLGTLLDSVNPLVFSTMAPNCIGWVLYGMYNQNYYVAVPSFLGYLLGTYYLLITGGMSSPDRQHLAIRTYLGFISLVFVSSIVSFISLSTLNGGSVGKQLVGWTCVLILVFMYASPLTTMWEVLKTRNSASIGLPLALASMLNGTFWGVYGIAIGDAFICVPNLVGTAMAIIQLILRFIFPSKPEIMVSRVQSVNLREEEGSVVEVA